MCPEKTSSLFKHRLNPSALHWMLRGMHKHTGTHMADNCLPFLHDDAMEGLWFRHNILSAQPKAELNINSIAERTGKNISETPPAPLSEAKAQIKSAEHKNRKRPTTLRIIVSQPVLRMQLPPPQFTAHSYPSLPTINTGPWSTGRIERKEAKKMRSYKSLSELENYELKGFMDLGFVFHSESLSPQMVSIIPGLQRLGKTNKGNVEVNEELVKRPYLSESWLVNSPEIPLLNLRMLPKLVDDSEMKKHLRFWARNVASLIHQEQ